MLEQGVLDRRGKLPLAGGHPDGDAQLPGRAEVRRQVAQRLPESRARLLRTGRLPRRRTDQAEARAGEFLARHQPLVGGRARVQVPVTPFQVHADAD